MVIGDSRQDRSKGEGGDRKKIWSCYGQNGQGRITISSSGRHEPELVGKIKKKDCRAGRASTSERGFQLCFKLDTAGTSSGGPVAKTHGSNAASQA